MFPGLMKASTSVSSAVLESLHPAGSLSQRNQRPQDLQPLQLRPQPQTPSTLCSDWSATMWGSVLTSSPPSWFLYIDTDQQVSINQSMKLPTCFRGNSPTHLRVLG